jgi:LysR family transcriptional regulator, transcriptional activator of nhaA
MDWLNYHHLLYFWTVYQEGSVTAASEKLDVAQPTVSSQIRRLEASFGHQLFFKKGRRLIATEFGEMVARYADDIFSAGEELLAAVEREPTNRPLRLSIGVAHVLPKLLSHALIEPAFHQEPPGIRLSLHEGPSETLLARLAVNDLDLVLSDAPIPATVKIKAYNHLLGESQVGLFGRPELVKRFRAAGLAEAPFLLPTANTSLRSNLDRWFKDQSIHPQVVAEFDDSALLKVFGETGHGLFPAPLTVSKSVESKYGVKLLTKLEGVKECVYAITRERRLTHPAIIRIRENSRTALFR